MEDKTMFLEFVRGMAFRVKNDSMAFRGTTDITKNMIVVVAVADPTKAQQVVDHINAYYRRNNYPQDAKVIEDKEDGRTLINFYTPKADYCTYSVYLNDDYADPNSYCRIDV